MAQQSKFYEESAVSRRAQTESRYCKIFQILGIGCFIVTAFWAFLSLTAVPDVIETYQKGECNALDLAITLILWAAALVTFILLGVVFLRVRRRFNVSYDYTFVEDELRITKVFNGRKRKFLVTIQADQILKIGYCDSQAYQELLAGLAGKKPKLLTPNREPSEDKDFIFLHVSTMQEKTLYIIECRKMLLDCLIRAAGITKFVRQ